MINAEERFWSHTIGDLQTQCVLWTGGAWPGGYGIFWRTRRHPIGAHQYALELKLGRPLQEGMLACHTCDTPLCVRETHLYEGTHHQNALDKWRRNPDLPRSAHSSNIKRRVT